MKKIRSILVFFLVFIIGFIIGFMLTKYLQYQSTTYFDLGVKITNFNWLYKNGEISKEEMEQLEELTVGGTSNEVIIDFINKKLENKIVPNIYIK